MAKSKRFHLGGDTSHHFGGTYFSAFTHRFIVELSSIYIMSCTSWIFIHKHIAPAKDGNGRIIERKILWDSDSSEIAERLVGFFDLANGSYRCLPASYLNTFADAFIRNAKTADMDDDVAFDCESLLELKNLLADTVPTDDFFVSVDW